VDVAATGEAVTSLGSEPVSGTSYAAPVVSGLAALIRARFPALTARQVMQRIESTAHHPPAGWDPLVGSGTIDALAAVSTDSGPPGDAPKPTPAPLPIITAPPPTPSNARARDTALRGAAIGLVALVATLATGAATGRLRRVRNRVPGE
jgi:membrane-anchored mycosin MYCP